MCWVSLASRFRRLPKLILCANASHARFSLRRACTGLESGRLGGCRKGFSWKRLLCLSSGDERALAFISAPSLLLAPGIYMKLVRDLLPCVNLVHGPNMKSRSRRTERVTFKAFHAFWIHRQVFGFEVPADLPRVPSKVLNPREAWTDKESYDATRTKLADMFKKNFTKFVKVMMHTSWNYNAQVRGHSSNELNEAVGIQGMSDTPVTYHAPWAFCSEF